MNRLFGSFKHKPIVFIHIPKCAGSSVQSELRSYFSNGLDVGVSKGKMSYHRFEKLIDKKPKQLTKYEVINGHISYAMCSAIPNAKYITLLRDPVRRFLSEYQDILRKGHSTHNHLLRSTEVTITQIDMARDYNLKTFVDSPLAQHYANMQVRYLLKRRKFGVINTTDLEEAKDTLQNEVSVFGLVEHYQSSLSHIGTGLGLRITENSNQVLNTSKRQLEVDEITIERIKELNVFDIELYSFAEGLFKERLVANG